MATYEGETPVFLKKKLGGLVLLVIGILLLALGLAEGSTWLTVLGIVLIVGGLILLALKVVRRNQTGLP